MSEARVAVPWWRFGNICNGGDYPFTVVSYKQALLHVEYCESEDEARNLAQARLLEASKVAVVDVSAGEPRLVVEAGQ